jgi:hypothetical protein
LDPADPENVAFPEAAAILAMTPDPPVETLFPRYKDQAKTVAPTSLSTCKKPSSSSSSSSKDNDDYEKRPISSTSSPS